MIVLDDFLRPADLVKIREMIMMETGCTTEEAANAINAINNYSSAIFYFSRFMQEYKQIPVEDRKFIRDRFIREVSAIR